MGFLDTLGAMLTPASYAVGGYMQGRQQAQQRDFQNNLQLMQLQRQQRADQATSDYRAAQMEDLKSQAASRQEQTTERKAKVAKDQAQDEGAFDILMHNGMMPPGVTPDMRSMGGWSAKLDNALKAKTVDEQIKARGDIQEHIADLNRQSQENIHTADRASRENIAAQGRANAVSLEQMKEQAKGGPGGPGKPVSAQMMQGLSRMGMSYNDLSQAVDQMDKFENDPKNLAKLTGLEQVKGQLSEFQPNPETHSLLGIGSNIVGGALGAAAQRNLAQNNPDLRQYLLNKQRVGLAFTEILPRPNQTVLGMEKGISGIDAGATPDVISTIQSRRRGGLNVIKGILSGQGYIGPNGEFIPGGPSAAPKPVDPYAPAAHAPAAPAAPGGSTGGKKRKVTIGGVSYDMP